MIAPSASHTRATVAPVETFVALDLETTGLNTDRDDIIEIAAVRFTKDEVLGEFSTFVRPEIELPLRVTQITGITPADLAGAPALRDVLDSFAAFVGDSPIVGHSVGFDLRFLMRRGILANAVSLDTYELATVVLPRAGRYSLRHLCALLALVNEQAHRALADAHAHRQLFQRLTHEAANLPLEVLDAITRVSEGSGWSLARVFVGALAEARAGADPFDLLPLPAKPAGPPEGGTIAQVSEGPASYAGGDDSATVDSVEFRHRSRPAPLDLPALEALLAPGGAMDNAMGAFEDRPGQRDMLRHVASAFDDAARLFVEAGTGTGKTLAYLLPAASWAVTNGGRVVVSTHTIALQEQLIGNDIPMAAQLVPGLRAALLKGRSHYLCRTRLAGLGRRTGLDADGARAAAKILAWAHVTTAGDRAEIRLQPEEMAIWRSVCAEDDACSGGRCPYARAGTCWVHRARRRAEASHIVVVNHALLISDMRAEGRVLPPYDRLIIDEAHHLEDVATDALGFRCSPAGVSDLLADISPRGRRLMARVEAAAVTLDMPVDGRAEVRDAAGRMADTAGAAVTNADAMFAALKRFHRERSEGAADLRLTAAVRSDPSWLDVETAWELLDGGLGELEPGLGALTVALAPFQDALLDPGLPADLSSVRRDLGALRRELGAIVSSPGRSDVAWVATGGRDKLALARAPLTVGGVLGRRLFADKETVVLTSATLRDSEGFDLIRDRLGLPEADAAVVASPFDFATAALLYLPNDMPDPYHTDHGAALSRAIIDLAGAAHGRTLVLFTSHSELREVYHRVRGPLAEAGIAVLGQGIDGTRHNLLEGFRDPETRTVLMGTRSFWEGIDVPGESLSCLVITRLPFEVPTDPVFAARSETFDDPFREYALPGAVLRFRQGFGRLIRTATDRGVVTVLDSRILSRAYGEVFLDALPPVQRRVGPLSGLGAVAHQFLEETLEETTP